MTPAALLAQARTAGAEITIVDGKLATRGVPPEMRPAVLMHRPALVALLTGKPAPRWPELPPLPADDEHARWLRGEISLAQPVAWTDRIAVIAVVEDLADEGKRVGRISRTLGLRRDEVLTILRRSGR